MIIRYSMIDTFLQCPTKFRMQYIEGVTEETTSSALKFGSALHLAIKSYFEGEDPYETFNMYWNSVKSMNVKYDRYSWEDLRALAVDKFLPNFIRLHAKKFSSPKLEETVSMPILESHELQGTFDLAGQYEGKLTLTDWKTSSKEYPYAKIIRNPQMYIYAALYKHKYGVLPEQLMYKVFIKPEARIQTLKIDLTEEKLVHTMNNVELIIKNMISMMNNKTYYSNYNCYCLNPGVCYNDN